MKSYPSSELRNVCDEQTAVEPAEEGQDILQQMLERRSAVSSLVPLKSIDRLISHKMDLCVVYIITQIFTPYSVLL